MSKPQSKRTTCNPSIMFAVYKGDELLTIGTKEEVCNELGCTWSTLEMQASPSYRKRRKTDRCRHIVRWYEEEK